MSARAAGHDLGVRNGFYDIAQTIADGFGAGAARARAQLPVRGGVRPRMNVVELIRRKRDGGTLSADEIGAFVRGVTDGSVPDYQAAALLMAIYFRGLDGAELAALTDAMLHSGDVLDLSDIAGRQGRQALDRRRRRQDLAAPGAGGGGVRRATCR